jgi:Ca2+-binding RTX toxin-like protein
MAFTGSPGIQKLKQQIQSMLNVNELNGNNDPYHLSYSGGTKSGWSFGYPQYDLGQGASRPFGFDTSLSSFDDLFSSILLSAKSGTAFIFDPTILTNRTLTNCPQAQSAYNSAVGAYKKIDQTTYNNIEAALNSSQGQSLIDNYTDSYYGDLITKVQTLVGANTATFAQSNLFTLLVIDSLNWFGPNTLFPSNILNNSVSPQGYQNSASLSFGLALEYYVRYPNPNNVGKVNGASQAFRRLSNLITAAGGYTPSGLDDAMNVIRAYSYLYLKYENTLLTDTAVPNVNSFISLAIAPADLLVVPWLNSTYGLQISEPLYRGNIYIGDNNQRPDPGSTMSLNGSKVPENDILVAGAGRYIVRAGNGNDILIAGNGNDTLIAGTGLDTLVGGLGNTLIVGGLGGDTYDFAFAGVTAGSTETIQSGINSGSVQVQLATGTYQRLTGGTQVSTGQNPTWTDGNGDAYQFVANPTDPTGNLGTLTISQGLLGSGQIVIKNFDLIAAQSSTGYLGIKFEEQTKIKAGTSPLSAASVYTQATSAFDPPAGTYTFTAYVSAISTNAQQITLTMTQGDPTGFAVDTGNGVVQFNSDGTVTLTIPAGQDSATFGLINTTDVTQNEAVKLTSTITNADGTTTTSAPFEIDYVAGQTNNNTAANTINGDLTPINFGTASSPDYHWDNLGNIITDPNAPSLNRNDNLNGSSGNDLINTGGGSNYVDARQGGNDTIYGGNGNDTIYAGNGNNQISGNGGQDIISAGNGNNQIYAGALTDIASAITASKTGTGSGQKGSFITVGNGDNTVVGGVDNSAFVVGTGNDLIVLGSGNSILLGGLSLPLFFGYQA